MKNGRDRRRFKSDTRQVLPSIVINDPAAVHRVVPSDVPNPNWLRPGIPSGGQQQFGDALLARNTFVVFPSAVSCVSRTLIFDAAGRYARRAQDAFALDTRLHPPASERASGTMLRCTIAIRVNGDHPDMLLCIGADLLLSLRAPYKYG